METETQISQSDHVKGKSIIATLFRSGQLTITGSRPVHGPWSAFHDRKIT